MVSFFAGAIWEGPKGQGRIAVLGSVTAFEDIWLEKEDNSKLLDFLLLWLTRQTSIEVRLKPFRRRSEIIAKHEGFQIINIHISETLTSSWWNIKRSASS